MANKYNRKAFLANKAKRAARNNGAFSEVSYFKPPKGDSYWKLLPPFSEDGNPCSEVLLYFGYKNAEGNYTVYKGLESRDCPLMKNYLELKGKKDKQASSVKPKRTYQYNVVNVKTGEQGVLQFGQMVQDEIDMDFEDRDEDFDPFDMESSYVLKIKRMGTSWNDTKYKAKFVKVKETNIPDDLDLDNLPNLNEIHANLTKEELQMVVDGEPPQLKKAKEKEDVEEVKKPVKKEKKQEKEDVDEVEDLELEDDLDIDDDIDEDEEFQKTIAELEDL